MNQHQTCDVNTGPGLTTLSPGCLLVLPQSFGNIYLGETFTSYVCVHNDSTEVCSTVVLRADLQTATQRINLVPGSESLNNTRESLAPGSSIDQVTQSATGFYTDLYVISRLSTTKSRSWGPTSWSARSPTVMLLGRN